VGKVTEWDRLRDVGLHDAAGLRSLQLFVGCSRQIAGRLLLGVAGRRERHLIRQLFFWFDVPLLGSLLRSILCLTGEGITETKGVNSKIVHKTPPV
jgi:hypothetical protein